MARLWALMTALLALLIAVVTPAEAARSLRQVSSGMTHDPQLNHVRVTADRPGADAVEAGGEERGAPVHEDDVHTGAVLRDHTRPAADSPAPAPGPGPVAAPTPAPGPAPVAEVRVRREPMDEHTARLAHLHTTGMMGAVNPVDVVAAVSPAAAVEAPAPEPAAGPSPPPPAPVRLSPQQELQEVENQSRNQQNQIVVQGQSVDPHFIQKHPLRTSSPPVY